jgi:hypothetical protein
MLALADKHGEVMASIPGLSKVAGLSIELTEKSLEKLLSPDPYSRTPDEEGRRIQVIDGGWLVINYAKHRRKASVDEERERAKERQQRFRDKNKQARNGKSQKVTDDSPESQGSNATVTDQTDNAEAEADADTSPKRRSRATLKMLCPESIEELKRTFTPLGVKVEFEVEKAKRWMVKHPNRKLTVAFMENWLEKTAKESTPPKPKDTWVPVPEPEYPSLEELATRHLQ